MIISELANVVLPIPAWQVALYLALTTLFMLRHDRKLCFITTYLFTLYWVFVLYGGEFVRVAQGSPEILSFYIVCGILHVSFTLLAFLQEG